MQLSVLLFGIAAATNTVKVLVPDGNDKYFFALEGPKTVSDWDAPCSKGIKLILSTSKSQKRLVTCTKVRFE